MGHHISSCPEKETLCYLCKADHNPAWCPLNSLCFNCMHRGHLSNLCPNRKNIAPCLHCANIPGAQPHHSMQCRHLWRQYKFSSREISGQPYIYCYMCGEEGHYGDDCRDRPWNPRAPRASAFNASALHLPAFDTPSSKSKNRASNSTPSANSSRKKPTHRRFSSSPSPPRRNRSRSRSRDRSRRQRSPDRRRSYGRRPERSSSADRYPRTRSLSRSDGSGYSDADVPQRSRHSDRRGSRSDRPHQQDRRQDDRDKRVSRGYDGSRSADKSRHGQPSSNTPSGGAGRFKPSYQGSYGGGSTRR
ncbi:hypothetical protein BDZ88DRAFT_178217 [Geranomyces variabilis]|nr:hypothetical protein BDZ88DRAFT_178217 [Geranomyces variabilis]